MKIAAIGDLHTEEKISPLLHDLFAQIITKAQILILCGDLTANGTISEAEILSKELSLLKIPIVGVLGNHDFDSNHYEDIKNIIQQSGAKILDGETFVLDDVGFAGVKGFGGGFGAHMLPVHGEEASKQFAIEAVNEALRLENALANLETKQKVAILHYAPIEKTLEGESLEVIPFLGSTHLAEPIDNFNVSVAFHGHSHFGKLSGKTLKGVPVFNVSFPLLKRMHPEHPYFIYDLAQK